MPNDNNIYRSLCTHECFHFVVVVSVNRWCVMSQQFICSIYIQTLHKSVLAVNIELRWWTTVMSHTGTTLIISKQYYIFGKIRNVFLRYIMKQQFSVSYTVNRQILTNNQILALFINRCPTAKNRSLSKHSLICCFTHYTLTRNHK